MFIKKIILSKKVFTICFLDISEPRLIVRSVYRLCVYKYVYIMSTCTSINHYFNFDVYQHSLFVCLYAYSLIVSLMYTSVHIYNNRTNYNCLMHSYFHVYISNKICLNHTLVNLNINMIIVILTSFLRQCFLKH